MLFNDSRNKLLCISYGLSVKWNKIKHNTKLGAENGESLGMSLSMVF